MMLQIKDLSYSIPGEHFWRPHKTHLFTIPELNIADKPGQWILLLGRNGSGKSTLLRCLLGLIKPTSGNALWYGNSDLVNDVVGYLPEFPIAPTAALVADWLSWTLGKKTFDEDSLLGILDLLDRPMNRLSKGQLQRVHLYGVLKRNPKILVLDEPFSGLDPWAKKELSEILLQLCRHQGTSLLLATHEAPLITRPATTSTWILEDKQIKQFAGCHLPEQI